MFRVEFCKKTFWSHFSSGLQGVLEAAHGANMAAEEQHLRHRSQGPNMCSRHSHVQNHSFWMQESANRWQTWHCQVLRKRNGDTATPSMETALFAKFDMSISMNSQQLICRVFSVGLAVAFGRHHRNAGGASLARKRCRHKREYKRSTKANVGAALQRTS